MILYMLVIHINQMTFRGDSDVILFNFTEMCSCPSPPRNGFISGCNVTGNTVEYSCRSGYYLVGASTRICLTGTTWTGLVPTCERGEINVNRKQLKICYFMFSLLL